MGQRCLWRFDNLSPRKNNLRRIVATEYLTLDGVMEAPNLWPFDFWNEQAAMFKFDELKAGDALWLGQVT
jgi:hypothetical protein